MALETVERDIMTTCLQEWGNWETLTTSVEAGDKVLVLSSDKSWRLDMLICLLRTHVVGI